MSATNTDMKTVGFYCLASISLSGIEFNNVPAVVTRHDKPGLPLLGMSFLESVARCLSRGMN